MQTQRYTQIMFNEKYADQNSQTKQVQFFTLIDLIYISKL